MNKQNTYIKQCTEGEQTESRISLSVFFANLHSDLAVFTNYSDERIKEYVELHQQIFSYLEPLCDKNIIRDLDMERFNLLVNPEKLVHTVEEDAKILEELVNYLKDTLTYKVQRENE